MVVQRLYLFASWGEVLMPSKSLRNSLCGNLRFVKFALVLAALFVIVLTSGPVYPQGDTGRILGVVADQSGRSVANAKVTITDVARGVSHPLTADSDRAYVAINLLRGPYTVRPDLHGLNPFA